MLTGPFHRHQDIEILFQFILLVYSVVSTSKTPKQDQLAIIKNVHQTLSRFVSRNVKNQYYGVSVVDDIELHVNIDSTWRE